MPPLTKEQQELVDILRTRDALVVGNENEHYFLWDYSAVGNGKKPKITKVAAEIFLPMYDHDVFRVITETRRRGVKVFDFEYVHVNLQKYIASK